MPVLPLYSSRKVISVASYNNGTTPVGEDGDFTPVIQAALNAILDNYAGYGTEPSDPPGTLTVSVKNEYILYFPPGRYRISSPVIMDDRLQALTIIGDNALIRPMDNALFEDSNGDPVFAFKHTSCYDFTMEGMNFSGFKKAVGIYNATNVDTSRLKISKCTFQGNHTSLELSCSSGIALIERSKFLGSDIALNIVAGDKVILRDCWISNKQGTAALPEGVIEIPDSLPGLVHFAPIINASRLTLESCILVPLPPGPPPPVPPLQEPAWVCIEPAWINNYGSVTVRDTRQGGETDSFTLVNNFAGVGNMLSGTTEPNSVIVKDSQCYAVYNNSGPNTEVNYFQPAILRYVTAIPNLTSIEDNRGLIRAKIMGFSKYLDNDDHELIQDRIDLSGPTEGEEGKFNVSVKVANNVGGFGHAPTGSNVPVELFPYVRDEAHLWPYKPSPSLPLLNPPHPDQPTNFEGLVDANGIFIFKFEYPADLNSALMINFSGNPAPSSSSKYSGGFTGILKANGFHNNSSGGAVRAALILEPLFNQIGAQGEGTAYVWPTGEFEVDVYWEATGDRFLFYTIDNTENRHFFIRIAGTGPHYNDITVTPLNKILR